MFVLEVVLTPSLTIAYVAILLMALAPIWIGAHKSLTQKATESLSSSDAWKFPLVGSTVLFGFYILFKIFSKEYINMLLTAYFLLFGILAMTAAFKPLFTPFTGKNLKAWKRSLNIPGLSEPIDIELDKADLFSLVVSLGIGVWYVLTKHWIANNIVGLAFCVEGVALLSLGSYSVGCILLGGLFFYDIFWVFGTDVMVTVAKSFEAPVKLLFPRDIFADQFTYSMLGLGDIVIPGVFIALLLRFDAFRANKTKSFSKPYFYACFIFYILGLFTTIFVMHTFQAAQPALLYLVPACIGSSFGTAVLRGEVSALLAYTEEKEKEKEESKKTRIK